MRKLRWGVLGVARIAVEKVIPAMQRCEWSQITAIASRDLAKAQKAARELGIAKAYGSYDELLADPEIEVVYNPLPIHLHVPWSIKAAEAGKHVLCEKPIGLCVEEGKKLREARDRAGVKIGEAFMVRTHPQWLKAQELVQSGRIGRLRVVTGFFSYHVTDPEDIRNILEYGGGGLMDYGCYGIFLSRFIFDAEPRRALGLVERDPQMGTDRLTSVILDFPQGQAVFTCGTQLVSYQSMNLVGTRGRIEMEIPDDAAADRPWRLRVDDGRDPFGSGIETIEMPVCNHYTLQGDAFSRAVQQGGEVAVPLESNKEGWQG